MKLKILIENTVFQPEAKGELGFSLYIETDDNHRILFDTGQSGLFADNAKLFDIDVNTIDSLVLSHGHYDHTGGLQRFLSLNDHASIFAKSGFDEEKYGRGSRYIGLPKDIHIPQNRLQIINSPTEIAEGVFILPQIHIFENNDTHFTHLQVKDGNNFIEDVFNDEQYIAIRRNGRLHIISGCAHRGIVNIIRSTQELFSEPIESIMGGFHTLHEEPATIHSLTQKLNAIGIKKVVVCHCTGIDQYAQIKQEFQGEICYGHVGMNIFL